ncbi:MAG: carboxypeptidase regulatory-like domain-containing protein, partial [Deltaproteobacteria bacterium]|nr:carboxypeptidase regulatory-like domain-containing protein [Deltaproteobacteria bacterium]
MPVTGLSVPDTPLTIRDRSQLIGGPAAQGRLGDVLLSNDKIRVIIQKPTKNAGIGSFGGTIIDAYHAGGGEGDQWGELFPMVNVEWTINYYDYAVVSDGTDGSPQILRAQGIIDTYDYLDLDWIADAASAVLNQQVSFADRFDDRRDPFQVNEELRDLPAEVVTEYRLDPGKNYVQIDTTFTNPSDHPISFPVGDFLAGSGALNLLIPGIGFAPEPTQQLGNQTPAVIYTAFDDGDVSYGYFFDPENFDAKTTSLSYSGLTGVLLGEEFLKILPIGSNTVPEIHFALEPESQKTITRYFVVGDGSAGSVLDAGLQILNALTADVSGEVRDAAGNPAAGAVVAVKKPGGGTVVTYRSDAAGQFRGRLPTGEESTGQMFGEGRYEVWVEKKGFHANGTARAGNCEPAQIDLSAGAPAFVTCTLGQSGKIQIGGVVDAETGLNIPARLTIVGEDPSPETKGAGTFSDTNVFKKPFGIVDSLLINAMGGIGLSTENSFDLEPVTYLFVFSHGPEYSIVERAVTVAEGGTVA